LTNFVVIYTLGVGDADSDVGQGIIGRARLPMMSKMNDMSKVHQLCWEEGAIFPDFNLVEGKLCVGLEYTLLAKSGCP
jgi:hypothetical protein